MPDERGDIHSGRTGAYDPRSLAPWIVLLCIILLAAAAGLLVPQARAVAPGFTLRSTGIEDGVQGAPVAFSLSDYRGRTLLLDFMAVNCDPCRQVTLEVVKPLWIEFGARPDFAILSVDTWADPALPTWQPDWESGWRLAMLQNQTGVPWRHALDTDQLWAKYDAVQLPKIVVVDPQGRIAYETTAPDLGLVEAAVRVNLQQ